MSSIDHLFANNKAWAQTCIKQDPQYFKNLAAIQNPRFLWIGCSDARVPANTIVGLKPGEVFVHRNIANQVRDDDPNCHAVIQFAVEVLGVQDIIVCGHYGCGGIHGAHQALENQLNPATPVQPVQHPRPPARDWVHTWLEPIKALAHTHQNTLHSFHSISDRLNHLCELNVHKQVMNVCQAPSVQNAWLAKKNLAVHGVIYDVHDGLLKKLDLRVTAHDSENR